MKSNASAVWRGKGVDGTGTMSTASTVLNNTPYSYKTRFVSGPGTNPEELIAAAHAGCFAMKLAFVFEAAGYTAERLETNCEINFEAGVVTSSNLKLKAKIPGIDKNEFDDLVEDAGHNCPVSKLLNTTLKIEAILE